MKRKKLTMLLACIIAGTFIAGCGSTTPAETNLKDEVVNDKDNNTDPEIFHYKRISASVYDLLKRAVTVPASVYPGLHTLDHSGLL